MTEGPHSGTESNVEDPAKISSEIEKENRTIFRIINVHGDVGWSRAHVDGIYTSYDSAKRAMVQLKSRRYWRSEGARIQGSKVEWYDVS